MGRTTPSGRTDEQAEHAWANVVLPQWQQEVRREFAKGGFDMPQEVMEQILPTIDCPEIRVFFNFRATGLTNASIRHFQNNWAVPADRVVRRRVLAG